MRILLGSSTLNVKGGYGNITFELVTYLKNHGHEVTLLLPVDDVNHHYDIEGVSIQRVLPKYIFRYKSRAFFSHVFWHYDSDKKFDVVHSLFEFPYAPLLCREARKRGLPFILGTQGTYAVQPLTQFPEKYAMHYAYKNAASIHAPSAYTKQAILETAKVHYPIEIIHNGVNFDRFYNHQIKQESIKDLARRRLLLLTVGELKSRKGQDLVIRALPEIVKFYPEVLYVLVGDPRDKVKLEALTQSLGVSANVLITGSVSDVDLLDYFHACKIYVHTPRVHNKYQFEGFGIVYLEAGACGKPSVATDAGGVSDAVLHGVTGLIGPDGDIGTITSNIISLLKDAELYNKLASNAQDYARKHTWDKIGSKFVEMYNRVITL